MRFFRSASISWARWSRFNAIGRRVRVFSKSAAACNVVICAFRQQIPGRRRQLWTLEHKYGKNTPPAAHPSHHVSRSSSAARLYLIVNFHRVQPALARVRAHFRSPGTISRRKMTPDPALKRYRLPQRQKPAAHRPPLRTARSSAMAACCAARCVLCASCFAARRSSRSWRFALRRSLLACDQIVAVKGLHRHHLQSSYRDDPHCRQYNPPPSLYDALRTHLTEPGGGDVPPRRADPCHGHFHEL
jgi:hypothetical protein